MKKYIEVSNLPNFEVTCSNGKKYVLLPFEHLSDIPAVDVVSVVRCVNCKHYQDWNDGNSPTCRMWTDQWDMPTEPNGYCHYGELKDSF